MGPQASLYPVAPGTLFHETTAALVLTADTFKICTALLSTDTYTEIERVVTHSHISSLNCTKPLMHIYLYFLACILVTCLDVGGGDGSLGVSKDGVDGDGVLRAWVEALDHVEVKRVPEVYVLYVSV